MGGCLRSGGVVKSHRLAAPRNGNELAPQPIYQFVRAVKLGSYFLPRDRATVIRVPERESQEESDPFDLSCFVEAQKGGWLDVALLELRRTRKPTHRTWFIPPR